MPTCVSASRSTRLQGESRCDCSLTNRATRQLIIPAFMGLYMDWEKRSSSKVKMSFCALHIFTIVLGSFMTVVGTYTTIQSIIDAYNDGRVGSAFTC